MAQWHHMALITHGNGLLLPDPKLSLELMINYVNQTIGNILKWNQKFWIKVENFLFSKMHLKMSSAKWQPFSLQKGWPFFLSSVLIYDLAPSGLNVDFCIILPTQTWRRGYCWLSVTDICQSCHLNKHFVTLEKSRWHVISLIYTLMINLWYKLPLDKGRINHL